MSTKKAGFLHPAPTTKKKTKPLFETSLLYQINDYLSNKKSGRTPKRRAAVSF